MICQKTIFSFDQWISRDTSFLFHKDFLLQSNTIDWSVDIYMYLQTIFQIFFSIHWMIYTMNVYHLLWVTEYDYVLKHLTVKKILFVELSLNFSISDKGRHIFIWLALIFICIPRFIDKTRLSFLIQSYIECKNKLSIIW